MPVPLRPALASVLGIILAAVLGACGAGDPRSGLPSAQVRDFDGPTLDLATLSPREKPMLVWIWGPF